MLHCTLCPLPRFTTVQLATCKDYKIYISRAPWQVLHIFHERSIQQQLTHTTHHTSTNLPLPYPMSSMHNPPTSHSQPLIQNRPKPSQSSTKSRQSVHYPYTNPPQQTLVHHYHHVPSQTLSIPITPLPHKPSWIWVQASLLPLAHPQSPRPPPHPQTTSLANSL